MLRLTIVLFSGLSLKSDLAGAQIPGTSFTTPLDIVQCAAESLSNGPRFPDLKSTVPKIIEESGYPYEVHEIKTADDYILTLFRIYNSRGQFLKDTSKTAVLIQHGFLGSSVDWLLNPIHKSLGFKLADGGFDVWLSNSRGTNYSLGHLNLSPEADTTYWDFSVHEMGIYDLPAVIDHILEVNGQDDLYYVGHSMGSTIFFIMTSERPEYNSKVRTMFALAPTVFRGTNSSISNLINRLTTRLQRFSMEIGQGRLVPGKLQKYLPLLFGYGCTEVFIRCSICQNALFFAYGYDPYQMNYTQLPKILANQPDSVSRKTFIHLGQMSTRGSFEQFDYDPSPGNEAVYGRGTLRPPSYQLSRATVPVVIFKGLGDTRALPNNVDKLAEALPNVMEVVEIEFREFNHLDFLFAKDVNIYVYDYLELIMKTQKYDNNQ